MASANACCFSEENSPEEVESQKNSSPSSSSTKLEVSILTPFNLDCEIVKENEESRRAARRGERRTHRRRTTQQGAEAKLADDSDPDQSSMDKEPTDAVVVRTGVVIRVEDADDDKSSPVVSETETNHGHSHTASRPEEKEAAVAILGVDDREKEEGERRRPDRYSPSSEERTTTNENGSIAGLHPKNNSVVIHNNAELSEESRISNCEIIPQQTFKENESASNLEREESSLVVPNRRRTNLRRSASLSNLSSRNPNSSHINRCHANKEICCIHKVTSAAASSNILNNSRTRLLEPGVEMSRSSTVESGEVRRLELLHEQLQRQRERRERREERRATRRLRAALLNGRIPPELLIPPGVFASHHQPQPLPPPPPYSTQPQLPSPPPPPVVRRQPLPQPQELCRNDDNNTSIEMSENVTNTLQENETSDSSQEESPGVLARWLLRFKWPFTKTTTRRTSLEQDGHNNSPENLNTANNQGETYRHQQPSSSPSNAPEIFSSRSLYHETLSAVVDNTPAREWNFLRHHQQPQCISDHPHPDEIDEDSLKGGCFSCTRLDPRGQPPIRTFIVVVAVMGTVAVVAGACLGILQATAQEHLTVALFLIGMGVVLLVVSAIAWRFTSPESRSNGFNSCVEFGRELSAFFGGNSQSSAGFSSGCPFSHIFTGASGAADASCEEDATRGGRYHPRLSAETANHQRMHQHPYSAMLYSEFNHRPPPPSYQASMQDYRLRLLLLERGFPACLVPNVRGDNHRLEGHVNHAMVTEPQNANDVQRHLRSAMTAAMVHSRPPSYKSVASESQILPNYSTSASQGQPQHHRIPQQHNFEQTIMPTATTPASRIMARTTASGTLQPLERLSSPSAMDNQRTVSPPAGSPSGGNEISVCPSQPTSDSDTSFDTEVNKATRLHHLPRQVVHHSNKGIINKNVSNAATTSTNFRSIVTIVSPNCSSILDASADSSVSSAASSSTIIMNDEIKSHRRGRSGHNGNANNNFGNNSLLATISESLRTSGDFSDEANRIPNREIEILAHL